MCTIFFFLADGGGNSFLLRFTSILIYSIIFFIVFLAFAEKLILFFYLGRGALNESDDVAYVQSGINFARTGTVSVWSVYPSAAIMPGMPVVAGIFCRLFGEGSAYIDAVRLCWCLFGSATVYVFYKCCVFLMPKSFALLAALPFLLINWAWSDNTFLTEPPYFFFFLLNLYYIFRLGEQESSHPDRKALIGFVLSFMAALMFRANIITAPLFAAIYLVFVKKKRLAEYIPHALALLAALLLFMIPWSIRNYRVFGEFIPLTNGSANPLLLGTYQGESAPTDESLDYETNVYKVIREEYKELFNEDGTLKNAADGEKIRTATDRLKAKYRFREWLKRDPKGLLWSYLVSKPVCMLTWVWFWMPSASTYYALEKLSLINCIFCVAAVILSFVQKKKRRLMSFLSFVYLFSLYSFAFSFASERYSAQIMPIRYMIAGIGLYLVWELFKNRRKKKQSPIT